MLNEIVEQLEEKIEKSLESSDLNSVSKHLENIKNPTLLCGVGGSHVVSTFLEKILTTKNRVITKNIDVEEYFLGDFKPYDNLIVCSYSGKNHGVKCLLNSKIANKYLFTNRKSKVNDEITLQYSIVNRTKSFISFDDTLIPMSLLLCYYLGTYHFPMQMIPKKEEFDVLDFDHVNIVYDETSRTCATFLETSIVEAGIASVTMYTKYSFCHGRSNLVNNKVSLVIYLMTRDSDLDNMLISEIPKICNNFLVLNTITEDSVIADYQLTIKSLYFLEYLNRVWYKEFVNVKYNKIIPTIYNFKGELV